MPTKKTRTPSKKAPRAMPIVSSAHLAGNRYGALSELEFALSMSVNAYQRWMVRCMAAALRETKSEPAELGPLDVLVLHHVHHRERPKHLTELAAGLNIEDQHTVNYGLKKLARLDLIRGERRGRTVFYETTTLGRALCDAYRRIRERCLIESLEQLGTDEAALTEASVLMRALSGIYDQAARSAASL